MSKIANRISYGLAGVAVVAGSVFIFNANHQSPGPQVQGTSTSTTTPVNSAMSTAISDVAAGKATLIDVRTPAEYTSGHAKAAINFESVNVQAGQLPDVPKDAKIYLYCHSGRRAGIVLRIMQQNGFTNVTNLGAFQDWLNSGGPQA